MPPVPAWFRLPTTLLSAVAALWGLVGAALSVALPQTPVWPLFGFEVVTAIAGILGLCLGLGYYRQAPALALACVAGTVLVAAFLGNRGSAGVLGTMSLRSWMLGRIALAIIMGALAALLVLSRNRKSWRALATGIAFGALPGVIALMFGLATLGYGRPIAPPQALPQQSAAASTPAPAPPAAGKSPAVVDRAVRQFMAIPILKAQKGGMEAARLVLLAFLGIVLIGLTSAGVHYVIKAFQLGAFPDAPALAGGEAGTRQASPAAGSPAA